MMVLSDVYHGLVRRVSWSCQTCIMVNQDVYDGQSRRVSWSIKTCMISSSNGLVKINHRRVSEINTEDDPSVLFINSSISLF